MTADNQSSIPAPVTNYRKLKAVEQIKTLTKEVTVSLRTEEYWDSTDIKAKKRRKIFVIQGPVKDKAQEHLATWEFVSPDNMQALVEGALRPIMQHIAEKERFPLGPQNLEISTAVTDWLVLGWSENHDGTFHGFAKFLKDGFDMEVRLSNLPSMHQFRNLVMAAY